MVTVNAPCGVLMKRLMNGEHCIALQTTSALAAR